MDTQQIQMMPTQFDAMAQRVAEVNFEFWFARDLQGPLDYIRWENFSTAIARAISSCETTGFDPADHFRGVTKMIECKIIKCLIGLVKLEITSVINHNACYGKH